MDELNTDIFAVETRIKLSDYHDYCYYLISRIITSYQSLSPNSRIYYVIGIVVDRDELFQNVEGDRNI